MVTPTHTRDPFAACLRPRLRSAPITAPQLPNKPAGAGRPCLGRVAPPSRRPFLLPRPDGLPPRGRYTPIPHARLCHHHMLQIAKQRPPIRRHAGPAAPRARPRVTAAAAGRAHCPLHGPRAASPTKAGACRTHNSMQPARWQLNHKPCPAFQNQPRCEDGEREPHTGTLRGSEVCLRPGAG